MTSTLERYSGTASSGCILVLYCAVSRLVSDKPAAGYLNPSADTADRANSLQMYLLDKNLRFVTYRSQKQEQNWSRRKKK